MDATVRHSPSFAVARLTLAGGESVSVESGAMMGTSAGVELEAKVEGGMLKGLKRSVLGGESLFITRFHAPSSGGWIDCAPRLAGDVTTIDVDGAVNLTSGSWLCSSEGVNPPRRRSRAQRVGRQKDSKRPGEWRPSSSVSVCSFLVSPSAEFRPSGRRSVAG